MSGAPGGPVRHWRTGPLAESRRPTEWRARWTSATLAHGAPGRATATNEVARKVDRCDIGAQGLLLSHWAAK